jgi:hypothetical protein
MRLKLAPVAVGVVVVLALLALLVVSQPVPSERTAAAPAPSASPTQWLSPEISPIAGHFPVIGTERRPVPLVSPTPLNSEELARSDRFWNGYLPQPDPFLLDFEFTSLADITLRADLIIRGRVTDFYVGEQWVFKEDEPTSPVAYARFEIEEVLKGETVSRAVGSVEVQVSIAGEDWDPSEASPLPDHEHLLFLMHEATYHRELGKPPRDYSEIAPFAYFIPSPQAVLRNIDGLDT